MGRVLVPTSLLTIHNPALCPARGLLPPETVWARTEPQRHVGAERECGAHRVLADPSLLRLAGAGESWLGRCLQDCSSLLSLAPGHTRHTPTRALRPAPLSQRHFQKSARIRAAVCPLPRQQIIRLFRTLGPGLNPSCARCETDTR